MARGHSLGQLEDHIKMTHVTRYLIGSFSAGPNSALFSSLR